MKKRIKITVLIASALILILSGCSNKPKTDSDKAEAIRNYNASIGDDAREYFADLSVSSCGVDPYWVNCTVDESASEEVLNSDPVPWQEMMTGTLPRLVAELHKKAEIYNSEEDCYSEAEIRAVLSEAVARGLSIDFCFDSDRETYSIDKDGKITVETITGADGGSYREKRDYQL